MLFGLCFLDFSSWISREEWGLPHVQDVRGEWWQAVARGWCFKQEGFFSGP